MSNICQVLECTSARGPEMRIKKEVRGFNTNKILAVAGVESLGTVVWSCSDSVWAILVRGLHLHYYSL